MRHLAVLIATSVKTIAQEMSAICYIAN